MSAIDALRSQSGISGAVIAVLGELESRLTKLEATAARDEAMLVDIRNEYAAVAARRVVLEPAVLQPEPEPGATG